MTSIPTLITTLHILARDIQSEDGVANAAIFEAAQVMQAMYEALEEELDDVDTYIRERLTAPILTP